MGCKSSFTPTKRRGGGGGVDGSYGHAEGGAQKTFEVVLRLVPFLPNFPVKYISL